MTRVRRFILCAHPVPRGSFQPSPSVVKQLFTLTILALAAGCAKKPQAVDVQVFIVTTGGENVKLGRVEVCAVPLDEATESLRPAIAGRDAALAKLSADEAAREREFLSQVEQYKQELAAANSRRAAAIQAVDRAIGQFKRVVKAASQVADTYVESVRKKLRLDQLDVLDRRYSTVYRQVEAVEDNLAAFDLSGTCGYSGTWQGSLDDFGRPDRAIEIVSRESWKALPAYRDAVVNPSKALQAAIDEAKTYDAEVRRLNVAPIDDFRNTFRSQRSQLMAPERLFAALPSPTVSAKTDADGRCRLALPTEQRWVLAAAGGRDVLTAREHCIWIVELPHNTDATVSFSPSNDNLLNPGVNPLPVQL